ncbi:hypothetical protein [Jeotgalibacillus haloalkalitolerans]|uniref:AbiV family abortive infection protein n=1 Tax=Jeotgalibacillus haloalkalitolerans TaxID=3104292 RepID=A0ABU5KQ20_9BACL|nr:hypothetical protein [Jeotgalibacillus sp. HH7-29]MDZ5713348.1 hypothetical protein [Jeotgalibacillus sp. HH7-29]
MDRSLFEMHWQYYLSIEKMLVKTNQYVTHSDKNKNTYSDELASILLLACSEIDSLLKQLCKNYGVQSKGKYFSMEDYAKVIEKNMSNELGLATGINTINDDDILIFPFEEINSSKPYANLSWWEDYQAIKHDRITNVFKGNLENAVSSVAAQHIILRELIKFIDKSNGQEHLKKNYWSEYWIPCV